MNPLKTWSPAEVPGCGWTKLSSTTWRAIRPTATKKRVEDLERTRGVVLALQGHGLRRLAGVAGPSLRVTVSFDLILGFSEAEHGSQRVIWLPLGEAHRSGGER